MKHLEYSSVRELRFTPATRLILFILALAIASPVVFLIAFVAHVAGLAVGSR